jgi:hypothetical protein
LCADGQGGADVGMTAGFVVSSGQRIVPMTYARNVHDRMMIDFGLAYQQPEGMLNVVLRGYTIRIPK